MPTEERPDDEPSRPANDEDDQEDANKRLADGLDIVEVNRDGCN
jgi:hypothetical protein